MSQRKELQQARRKAGIKFDAKGLCVKVTNSKGLGVKFLCTKGAGFKGLCSSAKVFALK
ncbi:8563_t:CDS:2, partial [Funneliformis caledonium]